MTENAKLNVACSLLYERGERVRPCVVELTEEHVARAVAVFNRTENARITTEELGYVDTDRYLLEPARRGSYFLTKK